MALGIVVGLVVLGAAARMLLSGASYDALIEAAQGTYECTLEDDYEGAQASLEIRDNTFRIEWNPNYEAYSDYVQEGTFSIDDGKLRIDSRNDFQEADHEYEVAGVPQSPVERFSGMVNSAQQGDAPVTFSVTATQGLRHVELTAEWGSIEERAMGYDKTLTLTCDRIAP